jgi:LAS superfamily LD-carboxypeptidase LdcB
MRLFALLILCSGLLQSQSLNDTLTGQSKNPNNGLHPQADRAFEKMRVAAAKDGVVLTIVSGYRSFERQRQIWNRKFRGYRSSGLSAEEAFDKVVEYSTLPGTSRHHWGTDIDIIDGAVKTSGDVLVPSKFYGNGEFVKCREWLENNGGKFGFAIVYTDLKERTGFKHEPWHWTYVPLSRKRYHQFLNNIDLIKFVRSKEIEGMQDISDDRLNRYLEEHIKGINPELQK